MSLVVNIKKLDEKAIIPSYAKEGDAGMDLTAVSRKFVDEKKFGYVEYDTGLAFAIPDGYVGFIFPRSSISDTGLILANAVGVVDSKYRGSVKCRFKYIPDTALYGEGERCAQIIIIPIPHVTLVEVGELDKTERGEGGFGSTNKTK